MPPERFAVIGDPIDHSLSPVMHKAALANLRLNGTYEAMRVAPAELPSAIRTLKETGYRGFNVTIPHKERVGKYLDEIDHRAAMIGAVNTVVNDGRVLRGYNTDSHGFARALLQVAPGIGGAQAVVFGAGGAARAVLDALRSLDAHVVVVARDPVRAAHLRHMIGGEFRILAGDAPCLSPLIQRADLLVNATPLGMSHLSDRSPLPEGVLPGRHSLVFDLVYGRATPLLTVAREAGCRTIDGLEMLIYQAVAAFELWHGTEPNVDVMRAACLHALAEAPAC